MDNLFSNYSQETRGAIHRCSGTMGGFMAARGTRTDGTGLQMMRGGLDLQF